MADLPPRHEAERRAADLAGQLDLHRSVEHSIERELRWYEDGLALEMFPSSGSARDVLKWIDQIEEMSFDG